MQRTDINKGGAKMIDKQPKEMTICNLEVLLMPQGEIICNGKTIGWLDGFREFLTKKKKEGNK